MAEHTGAAAPRADPYAGPLVAVGGSAGAIAPLIDVVRSLPSDLPAPVLVTIHIGEQSRSHLAFILSRAGQLPAAAAEDGDLLEAGRIYVAPPGRHLIVTGGRARLSAGPRVNRHRPAVDVMFASVAAATDSRRVIVVLSGVLDDGAVGAALVSRSGGHVLVQHPSTAEFRGMPTAAAEAAPGARSLPADELASAVTEIVRRPSASAGAHPHRPEHPERTMAESDDPAFLADEETALTRLVCPDCGGSLATVSLPRITYFTCHVGHQYAPQTLAAAQAETTEAKLWGAVAAMDEQAAFLRYLNRHRVETSQTAHDAPDDTDERARALTDRALVLREQVRQWSTITDQPPPAVAG